MIKFDENLFNKIVNGNKEADKYLSLVVNSNTKTNKQKTLCKIDSFDLKGENFAKFFDVHCDKKVKSMETLLDKMLEKNITKGELLEVIENDLKINISLM